MQAPYVKYWVDQVWVILKLKSYWVKRNISTWALSADASVYQVLQRDIEIEAKKVSH